MSKQTGSCSTTPQNDELRGLVLHSVTKQTFRHRDKVDTRSMVALVNALSGVYTIQEVRTALEELQDEGTIYRAQTRKGEPGWAVRTPTNKSSTTMVESLDFEGSARLDSPSEADFSPAKFKAITRSPRTERSSGTSQEVREEQAYASLLALPDFLGTKSSTLETGKTGSPGVVRGRYISRARRKASPSPDGPYGLAQYFIDALGETGMTWSYGTNRKALMAHFRQALAEGVTSEEIRRMIRFFLLRPHVVRNAGQPPWRQFVAQRSALYSHVHRSSFEDRDYTDFVGNPERTWTQEEMRAERKRMLAEIYSPTEPPQTPEEMRAERERILAEARFMQETVAL